MAFCQNCGEKLDDKARFCPICGNPVLQNDMSKRQQEYGGKIIKCPNCGEILPAFTTRCSACGYEIRGANASSAVKEFEFELKQIENGRRKEQGHGIGKVFSRAFGADNADPVDQRLASHISNFAVPNTQEDIFEFMILAASNIDPMAFDNSGDGYGSSAERERKLMVSNAWDSKYNQVYQKAKIMFPEDPRLVEVEKLYKSKQKLIKRTKNKTVKSWVGVIALVAAMYLLLFAIFTLFDQKERKLDKQLSQTVIEIQTDISNGDYDDALIKANTLHFDSDLSKSKAEDWDKQREALMELINEKKGNN